MEDDDQDIQIILMGLPEDIYAAIDSCLLLLTGNRLSLTIIRFSKLMNDFKRNKHFPEKIANNFKFLNNLQLEWRGNVTIVYQTKDLNEVDYTQLYDFLKYNQAKVNELRAERLARAHDPLALMANSNNPYNYLVFHQDYPSQITYMQQPLPNNNYILQPSFNQNYMQQPVLNPEDISDTTTAMNMALVLMAKVTIKLFRAYWELMARDGFINGLVSSLRVWFVSKKARQGLKDDESLAMHKALEYEIKRLLRAVVSQDIMSIVQSNSVIDTSNLHTELEVDNISKTKRPQPRSNTKNDWVPSASKSCCIKDKYVEVEEHHRNLLLSKNKKHMSSECNNIKLAIRNDKSKVVCAMYKQCLITSNHDVYVLNYVNDMNSRVNHFNANVSNTTNKKKHKPKVKKPKLIRMFDLKGKIIESSKLESQFDSSKGHSNLFMMRRLGMLKAYDRKSEAFYKFCLKVSGNGSLLK
ncbi:hypothetical protein Tco_1303335 [Tanacetum coccineum]